MRSFTGGFAAFTVVAGALATSLSAGSGASGAVMAPARTVRISVANVGESNGISGRASRPAVSANGTVVAFDSVATNLVGGDTNRVNDVFVRDRAADRTERVSVSSAGVQGDGDSTRPSVSGDGRFVAFDSTATKLVLADSNHNTDVFLRDRVNRRTVLVSSGLGGAPANGPSFSPVLSRDGRWVAFTSQARNLVRTAVPAASDNAYVRNLVTGRTSIVSLGTTGQPLTNAHVTGISGDGRFVVFTSFSATVVPGDTNDAVDVFVRDRARGTTRRVSVDSAGGQADSGSGGAAISADGRRVAFASDATNLIPGDTNAVADIFVHDLRSGATDRVSVGPDGVQANDQSNGPGIRGGLTFGPDISGDGRYVTFDSIASNLVTADTNTCSFPGGGSFPGVGQCPDIFVRDLRLDRTTRVSVSSRGGQANGASTDPAISSDGLSVAFLSTASNLAGPDTNTCPPIFEGSPGQCPDIYLHGR